MKVIIFNEQFIPGLGKGPYLEPVEISEDNYNLYKRMGLKMVDVSKKAPIAESGIRNIQTNEKININSLNNKERDIINDFTKSNIPLEEEDAETEENTFMNLETIEEPVTKDETEEIDTEEEVEDIVEETIEEVENNNDLSVEEEVEEENDEIDLENMTKKEIIELLSQNGHEADNKLNKKELVELAEELLA